MARRFIPLVGLVMMRRGLSLLIAVLCHSGVLSSTELALPMLFLTAFRYVPLAKSRGAKTLIGPNLVLASGRLTLFGIVASSSIRPLPGRLFSTSLMALCFWTGSIGPILILSIAWFVRLVMLVTAIFAYPKSKVIKAIGRDSPGVVELRERAFAIRKARVAKCCSIFSQVSTFVSRYHTLHSDLQTEL